MAKVDVKAVLDEAKTAVEGIVKKDAASIIGFSERQLNYLAQQAAWIARAEVEGEFKNNDALREFFLTNLAQLAKDFANALRGLAAITIEKIWNAVINVLWKAIEGAIHVTLPRPA